MTRIRNSEQLHGLNPRLQSCNNVHVVIGHGIPGLLLVAKLAQKLGNNPGTEIIFILDKTVPQNGLFGGCTPRYGVFPNAAHALQCPLAELVAAFPDTKFNDMTIAAAALMDGALTLSGPRMSAPLSKGFLGLSALPATILKIFVDHLPPELRVWLIEAEVPRKAPLTDNEIPLEFSERERGRLRLPAEKHTIFNATDAIDLFQPDIGPSPAPPEWVMAKQLPLKTLPDQDPSPARALLKPDRSVLFRIPGSEDLPPQGMYLARLSDLLQADHYAINMMLVNHELHQQKKEDLRRQMDKNLSIAYRSLGFAPVAEADTAMETSIPVYFETGWQLNKRLHGDPNGLRLVNVKSAFSLGYPIFNMDGMVGLAHGAVHFAEAFMDSIQSGKNSREAALKAFQQSDQALETLRLFNRAATELLYRSTNEETAAALERLSSEYSSFQRMLVNQGAKPLP